MGSDWHNFPHLQALYPQNNKRDGSWLIALGFLNQLVATHPRRCPENYYSHKNPARPKGELISWWPRL